VLFIRLADLIINLDFIATAKCTTDYSLLNGQDIPTINTCLAMLNGSLNGKTEAEPESCGSLECLEFKSDIAMAIWNYFLQSKDVTVLFE